tara:strand:+ start:686 stop:940 length:255 start_codon:yes stop_codon:yes gene_type:complete
MFEMRAPARQHLDTRNARVSRRQAQFLIDTARDRPAVPKVLGKQNDVKNHLRPIERVMLDVKSSLMPAFGVVLYFYLAEFDVSE